MDRFIERDFFEKYAYIWNLKSSMDRFIVNLKLPIMIITKI